MLSIKETPSKVSAPKKTITVKGAIVKDLKFFDETGDITSDVLSAIPEEFESIDLKITLELPEEEVGSEE